MKLIKQNGFTLIELLVVISIIGILTSLLLANFVGIRERASDVRKKNDVNQLKKALQLYYNDYQKYPRGQNVTLRGCGESGMDVCDTTFTAGDVVYMKQLPEETDWRFYNAGGTDDQFFVVTVTLDNLSDEDIERSWDRCATSLDDENLTPSEGQYLVCDD